MISPFPGREGVTFFGCLTGTPVPSGLRGIVPIEWLFRWFGGDAPVSVDDFVPDHSAFLLKRRPAF